MTRKIRLLHIINSFASGGAEAMLSNLLLRSDPTRFEASVATLIDDMSVARPVLAAHIPVVAMGMRPGVPDPLGLLRLARHLRKLRPDVIHTWMDHSNLIGGLACLLSARSKPIWSIHHSRHVAGLTKRTTLMTVAACARLSGVIPWQIVFCSQHSRQLYRSHGFAAGKLIVIPNGFDTSSFHADPVARLRLRWQLGIDAASPLVGLVARYHPLKDHATFFQAAALLARQLPSTRFLLCGSGVDCHNIELCRQIDALGIMNRCHLLGRRDDVAAIYPSLDLLVSSSISEAFPMAIGEAMSSQVPCVVTDVGDSAFMIGDTGLAVPPRDPEALAAACAKLLSISDADRAVIGQAARRRVCKLFDLTAIARRYERLYETVAASGPHNGHYIDASLDQFANPGMSPLWLNAAQ